MPIRETLEKATLCLRTALLAELPNLFATVIKSVSREYANGDATNCGVGLVPDPVPGEEAVFILPTRVRPAPARASRP